MTRMFRRLRSPLLAWIAVCIFSGVAWAADLNFEVRLAAPISEPTVLVITGFTKVMPVDPPYWTTEIGGNDISARIHVADVDPGGYLLEVRQPGVTRTLTFTVHLDGSVVFDPSPWVQQQTGDTIVLSP